MQKYLIIKKPTPFFYITLIICFLIWILSGDLTWRHVDDFGPIEALDNASTLKEYIKLFSYWGWGTYPPIWEYFSLSSYIFKPFGIESIRSICFLLAFFSISISSFLTCIISSLIIYRDESGSNLNRKNHYIEILSVLLNALNPEIILHANSNMPYSLSTISIQLIILSIFFIIKKQTFYFKSKSFIYVDFKYFIILTLFSIVFTFQSTIILSGLLITLIIYSLQSEINIKLKYLLDPRLIAKSYSRLFKNIKNIYIKRLVFYGLTFFLSMYLIKLLLIIFYYKLEPGAWANGINNIYNVSNHLTNPYIAFAKIINNLKSIVTQSVYPSSFIQIQVSVFFLILYLASSIKLFRRNTLSKFFSIFSFSTILVTILLSLKGNFIFSPTRHTIFLYPLFWIPLIINFETIFSKLNFEKLKIIFITLTITFYSLATFDSIRSISYSDLDNTKLINLLRESDFYLHSSYEPFSNFSLHGNKEYRLTNNKKCLPYKIKNLSSYKIFMFNHRNPFVAKKDQLDHIFKENKDCLKSESEISIIKKIEKQNNKDIEQNNLIFNGGSSLYGYLIKVTPIKEDG